MTGLQQAKCEYFALQEYESATTFSIIEMTLLTNKSMRKQTFDIKLQCPEDFKYNTADYFYIYPENIEEDV